MSFETERKVITDYLIANWNTTNGPIMFENADFKQPEGSFIAMTIVPHNATKACISTTKFDRYYGSLQLDVFTQEKEGTKTAKTIADILIGIFNQKEFTTTDGDFITFRTPEVRNMGVRDGRYRLIVICDFLRNKYS